MNYKLLITLSLLLFSQLVLAEITVKVDREPVVVDESFHLIFESDQKIDAKPDFSALTNSFTVLDTRHRSNTQITNGKISYSQMWIVSLIANKAGTVGLPSIRFDKELTRPLSINVLVGSPTTKSSTTDNIFVDVEVNTKSPYVQAQLVYTVRLYRAIVTNNASLSEPEVTGGQAVINRLGEDSSFETQRNGKRYVVIERQYVIFPQSSGPMTIQPIVFQGQTGGAGGFFSFDRFNQPTSMVKRSKSVEVNVKPIPDSFTGETWLPANHLSIEEQWSVDPSKLEQGEATTRTLTLKANGLAASHLPEIKSNLPDALKQYPDQPEFDESNNADGYIGVRSDKMAIIPTKGGDFTLPAIKIPWWNTDTDKMEIAELPERNIQIEGSTASVPVDNVIKQQTSTDQDTVIETGNNNQNNLAPITLTKEEPLWKWVSLCLLVLWLLTVILFWRSKRNTSATDAKEEENISKRKQLKKIQQACKSNAKRETQQALLDWANSHWLDKRINNLNALKEYSDEGFKIKLDELNSCLYGSSATQWDGTSFLISFESQSFDKKQSTIANGKLEPLYKT
jgi:oxygen tolerance protein BatD